MKKQSPPEPCIYIIHNAVNQKVYVGHTRRFRERMRAHRYLLRKGKHPSPPLQGAWNKHGEQAFSFAKVEDLPNYNLETFLDREVFWIQHHKSYDKNYGYNTCPRATRLGVPHTAETKRRMSEHKKLAYGTPAFKEQCRQRMLGKSPSSETREKMRQSNLGKTSYNIEPARIAKYKPVGKLNDDGVVDEVYMSVQEAAECNGVTRFLVGHHCRNAVKNPKYLHL